MLSLETAILAALGLAQGYIAIPLGILLVRSLMSHGPFPNRTRLGRAISAGFMSVFMLAVYFGFPALLAKGFADALRQSGWEYMQVWAIALGAGILVWLAILGIERLVNSANGRGPSG